MVADGGLLENRARAWHLEAPRLLASLARLLGLVWGSAWLSMVVAGGSLLVLGALGWLYKLRGEGCTAASAAGATG